jgi:hypothetical protein
LWLIMVIFFNSLLGDGVQLGPLGTAATDWPIVPAPGDYDDGEFCGMKIGRGNRRTRRKLTFNTSRSSGLRHTCTMYFVSLTSAKRYFSVLISVRST